MNPTRRAFLKAGGAAVSISFLAPRFALPMTGMGARSLVVVQLAGGNDALNTFIPYADARYRSLRPELAIADGEILKVGSAMGLHPSLARLAALYEQRRFAFVNGVGFPTLDRSHFHCQDVWQTGLDDGGWHGGHAPTGWLGRYADLYLHDGASSLTALSVGNRIPLGMSSELVVPSAVSSVEGYDIVTGPRFPEERTPLVESLRGIYESSGHAHGDLATIRTSGDEMFDSIDLLTTIPPPSAAAAYPESALGRGMELVAQVLAGEVGTRLVWIVLGGFDTHSGQPATHAALLADLDASLGAFQDDLDGRGLADDVIVLAWSEFGRRAQENASAGTDHGKAGSIFLMGNGIKGGTFYGEVPSLTNLDSGDLRTEIDFRAVYATIIRDWLDRDPEPVLYGAYENLGFVEKDAPPRRRLVRR